MNALLKLNAAYIRHLNAIRTLTLAQWLDMAAELEVATNDREHAAKKLAIRELAR
jgi:hypothetical protein